MTGMMKRSVVVLGVALAALAGGCNNGLKNENAQLRDKNTELQTKSDDLAGRLNESEARRQQAEGEAQAKAARAQELEMQMVARPAQQPQQPRGPVMGNNNRRGGSEEFGNGGTVLETLTVAGDVLFGPGSATLTKGGKTELDQVARTIKSKYNGHSVQVEGFTDSDPITKSSWTSNKALSQARADAVERYLITKGLPDGRVSALGMGSTQPKGTKAASRRVEIKIMG